MMQWVLYDSLVNSYLCDDMEGCMFPVNSGGIIIVKLTSDPTLGALPQTTLRRMISDALSLNTQFKLNTSKRQVRTLNWNEVREYKSWPDNVWLVPVNENREVTPHMGYRVIHAI